MCTTCFCESFALCLLLLMIWTSINSMRILKNNFFEFEIKPGRKVFSGETLLSNETTTTLPLQKIFFCFKIIIFVEQKQKKTEKFGWPIMCRYFFPSSLKWNKNSIWMCKMKKKKKQSKKTSLCNVSTIRRALIAISLSLSLVQSDLTIFFCCS
mgnify:CR=1 FL=1